MPLPTRPQRYCNPASLVSRVVVKGRCVGSVALGSSGRMVGLSPICRIIADDIGTIGSTICGCQPDNGFKVIGGGEGDLNGYGNVGGRRGGFGRQRAVIPMIRGCPTRFSVSDIK